MTAIKVKMKENQFKRIRNEDLNDEENILFFFHQTPRNLQTLMETMHT